MSGEFGTGKTIFVLAIVVGCFAVLWPKIFYPMLTASVKSPATARQAVGWKNLGNSEFLQQLCYLLEEHSGARWSHEAECWLFLESSCHLELNESMLQDYRLVKDKTSFTDCLSINYGLSPNIVSAAVPPKIRPKSYTPQVPWSYVQGDLNSVELDAEVSIEPWADLKTPRSKHGGPSRIKATGTHVRSERPAHLYPEMMHPALREKGRVMPQRTADKNPRPGPLPGMRPTMGGAGGMVPPPAGKGSGAMGIIMPLYTVGIVVFFVYTIMKVLFKKGSDDDKAPKLKDFGLDPEYRKYVFAEEYLDNQNISQKSQYRREQREESRQRKKMHEVPDTKIEDEQMDHLRQRLEDTELAMERLMNQMGSVTDKLTAAKITEVLSQAQAQAKILKNEENSASSKGSSPDMEEYEVINKEGVDQKASKKESKQSSPSPSTKTNEECPKTTSAPKETVEETKTETENKEPESTSTTITSAEEEVKEMPITSHSEEDDDNPKNTINTHESLSPNSPPPTQENSNTDKVENNITDTVDTDQSKKENLITEKLSSEQSKKENLVSEKLSSDQSKEENLVSEKLSCKDVSSSKLVSDDEGKSIGKVEE